ncbi:MAG: C13 family peptidase [Bdellovibrio sp.]
MKFFLTFLSTLIFSGYGYCENIWIHAVGIDEQYTHQNYDTFYNSAVAFNKECEQSKIKPNCSLYINDNTQLRPSTSNFSGSIKNNSGPIDTQSFKKTIADKIINAKDKDTVIISLQNHGAPVDGQSPACIWLSSNDYICENDLAEILKSKPKGVKVFINADACFSGAFADLSSSEVCTTTQANKLEFGYTNRRSLWNAISERHPSTLHDLVEPIVKESGQQRLLSSQVILQQLCKTARKKTSLKSVISSLSVNDSQSAGYDPSACRDNDITAKKLSTFTKQVLSVIQKNQSCKDLALPTVVCDAQKRLKSKKETISQVLKELEPIKSKEIELKTWMTQNAASIPEMMKPLQEQMNHLTIDEKREIIDSIKINRDPDWSKFKGERVSEIKKSWAVALPLLSRFAETSKNIKQIDESVAQLKKMGAYDDLVIVQGCYYENSPQTDSRLKDYKLIGQNFSERKFTEDDYEKALKCESSIQF